VRVLIVEDDKRMAAAVRRGLQAEGIVADLASTGEDALWMAGSSEFDAMVLDVMLPGIDGFETCKRLREDGVWAPIIMLTARDSVSHRVARRQHEDRRPHAGLAQAAADLQPVDPREHEVEKDCVVFRRLGLPERVLPAGGQVHCHSLLAETPAQEPGQLGLVFHDQHSHLALLGELWRAKMKAI
jgi:CheY-like chemotaxis protein